MRSPGISAKRRHGVAGFGLGCGCKDAKSVSVSASVSATSASPSAAGTSTTTTETRRKGAGVYLSASTATDTLTSALSSWEDAMAEFDCCNDDDGGFIKLESLATAQSFSGLLRELNELERSVVSWGRKSHHGKKLSTPSQESHRKVKSSGKCGDLLTMDKDYYCGGDSVEVGLDGSVVAVVKQSEDPLGDFRQSMLQMVVENGIVAGVDLREMLRRFLTLNAPHHHDVILCAFAEICDAVFEASFDPGHDTRLEPAGAMPPTPMRTPPRHRHPPSAWRV